MTESNDPKTIVTDFLATFSAGDVDGLLDHMAPSATWWVSGSIEGMSGTYGKEQLGLLLRGVKSIYKEGRLQITPSRLLAEGNFVAVEADSYAELTNGRIYNNKYHFLFEITGGKIASVREYMDTRHAYDIFFAP